MLGRPDLIEKRARAGTSGGRGFLWGVLVDLPPLPLVAEVSLEKAPPSIQVLPYAGSPSLASWKASRRSVLSVRLSVKEPLAFLVAQDREFSSIPETCVPWDYRWPEVPVRWAGFTVREGRASLDEYTASFDPRRCAVSPARRRHVEMDALLSVEQTPLLFGYRTASSVFFFVPPGAALAADAASRHPLALATRVELSATQGGALLASFGEGLLPPGKRPFALRIDVLPGPPPQIVAHVDPA